MWGIFRARMRPSGPSGTRWISTRGTSPPRASREPLKYAEGRRRRCAMTELASKTCVPCRGDVPPLKGAELEELSRQVPGWEVVDEHHLKKEFRFKNFREAL